MAETFKCAFLILAFVTCFQILSIEGRPIKPTNKQELLTYEKEPLKEMASQSRNTNLHHSTADNQKVSLTSPPVHIPSVHHSKGDIKESQLMVLRSSYSPSVRHPETLGANSNNGHSVNAFKDDFEPTAPGHNPGVDHIHADEDQDDSEDVDPKAPGSSSNSGHVGVAFKPTKPGRSPGVGHISSVNQSDKIDSKTSNFENSTSEHSVTTPGHNFGFSHILRGQDQDDSEDHSKEPGFESNIGHAGAAFKPTTPGHSPSIGHMSLVDQSDKTDLRPPNIEHSVTTSGHIHGVGHILLDQDQDDNEDVEPKAPGSGSSSGRAGAAFKPTKPGHSPGVGHISSVDQSDNTEPKASNFQHSVTTLGHSPRVGHVHADEEQDDNEDVDPKAPGSGSSTRHAGATFKPTKLGHSPGVGHISSVDQSDKTEPKASNLQHSVTTPGYSLGVGHIRADEEQDDSEDVDAKAPGSGSRSGPTGAAFKPTKPGHSPGVGHISSVDQSDKTESEASNFEHSVTTPGHSPGVSHIHADKEQDDNEDVDPKAPVSGSSSGRAGAAFKPTKPGHSPGVGHISSIDQSDNTEPKASNFQHSVTTLGHSPGVGHIHAYEGQDDMEDVDPKAPGSGSSSGRAGAAFKPTTPGHSPGVGHMSSVDQSDQTDLRPSNIENSVTTPGHSAGVGYILADQVQDDNEDIDPKAPGSGSGSGSGRAGAAFKPTKPGHSPGVGHISSLDQSDDTELKASNSERSVTTPSHSPRVGHVHVDEEQDDSEDVDPKAPGSGSSTGRAGAAFKPTKPGHSPGVGHISSVDQSDNNEPKASNFEHSVTTLGHSPGVGHIHADEGQDDMEDVDPKAPGSGSSTGRAGAAFKPTTPGHSPGVGYMSSVDQSDKTDLRPSNIENSVTTPGHSAGVGYTLSNQDQDDNEDIDPKAPGSGSSIRHVGAAFKPTKPGHSPDVGHMSSVDQSVKIDPNHSNIDHSVTRVPNF